MIYDKQSGVLSNEVADHRRRIDVASGAIKSLEEKQKSLGEAKKTDAIEAELKKIDSEIERHTKTTDVEKKVLEAVDKKKKENEEEYKKHVESCQKVKGKANVAIAGVNDAALTLKNQREY
jgi:predicted  nucleic acid-binding Zn-ribbon protein